MTVPAVRFETLIERHHDEIYSYLWRLLNSHGGPEPALEAQDLAQEVYLRAIEVWHAGHPPRDPVAWLQTLARNLLINYYRKHRPRLVDPSLLNEAMDPQRRAATPEAVALIHRGLARLPDRHARLVEAFHLEGRSVREIATAEGLSERAVEGRLHRAHIFLHVIHPAGSGNGAGHCGVGDDKLEQELRQVVASDLRRPGGQGGALQAIDQGAAAERPVGDDGDTPLRGER